MGVSGRCDGKGISHDLDKKDFTEDGARGVFVSDERPSVLPAEFACLGLSVCEIARLLTHAIELRALR